MYRTKAFGVQLLHILPRHFRGPFAYVGEIGKVKDYLLNLVPQCDIQREAINSRPDLEIFRFGITQKMYDPKFLEDQTK